MPLLESPAADSCYLVMMIIAVTEIIDYITSFLAKHGYEPSYAQIARRFGVSSKATIAKHISALEKRGLIKREHGTVFTIGVKLDEATEDAVCSVRLVGRIAAGVP